MDEHAQTGELQAEDVAPSGIERDACPMGCGRTTDDPYGGPCEMCWDDAYELNELECTHCGGDGECDANANPLWDCDDQPHPCHACGGTGNRRDQRIW